MRKFDKVQVVAASCSRILLGSAPGDAATRATDCLEDADRRHLGHSLGDLAPHHQCLARAFAALQDQGASDSRPADNPPASRGPDQL